MALFCIRSMAIHHKLLNLLSVAMLIFVATSCNKTTATRERVPKSPIDMVNPLVGSLSLGQMALPATVQLPHALLAISPMKGNFTSNYIEGLSLVSIPTLGNSQFYICPSVDTLSEARPLRYTYDYEQITPYDYQVYLDHERVMCNYSLQEKSGIYQLDYRNASGKERLLLLASSSSEASFRSDTSKGILGTFPLKGRGYLYLYLESKNPISVKGIADKSNELILTAEKGCKEIILRYGISLISHEQAKENLRKQIPSYEYNVVAKAARNEWSTKLERITLEGGTLEEQKVFYTALYRSLTAPVCISEYGRYYSPYDDSVHNDEGMPFYTIDRTSESFRTLHPLKTLLFPETEQLILNSYLRMAEQSKNKEFPAFPSLGGDLGTPADHNRMLQIFSDAYSKGITDIDIQAAYQASKNYIETRQYTPYDYWAYKRIANFSGHPIKEKEKKQSHKVDQPTVQLIHDLEPYNIREIIVQCGSQDTFERLLDERIRSVLLEPCTVHNMYGYYLYAFTRHPSKSQKIVRHVLNKNFRCDPAGFPTAVDGASLGAAVVFSMLGFYPVTPGINEYTIGAPIFSKSTLDQGGGRYFTLTADNASERNKYVSHLTLNDKPIKVPHFSHTSIAQGGTVKMTMNEYPQTPL